MNESIHQYLSNITGLFTAIGSLLIGLAACSNAISRIVNEIKRKISKKEETTMVHRKPVQMWFTFLGCFFIALSIAIFSFRATIATPIVSSESQVASSKLQSLNVHFTNLSWVAYNNHNYIDAIMFADSCIREFKGAADREQRNLEQNKTPAPPTNIFTPKESKIISSRGLLNDVATCFFIKGYSLEKLNRIDEAKIAYQAASSYSYARCWDTQGWFWSPAESATDRLSGL